MKKLLFVIACTISAWSGYAQDALTGSWTLTDVTRTLLREDDKPEQTLQNYVWAEAYAKKELIVFGAYLQCTFSHNNEIKMPIYQLLPNEIIFSFTNGEGKISKISYEIVSLTANQFILKREDPLLREVYHFTR